MGEMARRFRIDAETVPDLPGMMLATVEALKDLGGSATVQELDEKVIELEGVTEAEQAFTMPNTKKSRVGYYLAWARTYLKRGGAVNNSSRGVWALTAQGEAVSDLSAVRAIHDRVNLESRERSRQKDVTVREADADTVDGVETMTEDGSAEDEDWKSELLGVLGKMPPDRFERLAQRLLREAGFIKVEVRGKSGDGGIDGVGVLRVNLVSFQVYFQCKRWKGSVSSKEIRDFRGALQGRADKGLFITTGHFTIHASDEATRDGAIAIDLIDGDRLCDLLKENQLGVATQMIERVRIQTAWFDGI